MRMHNHEIDPSCPEYRINIGACMEDELRRAQDEARHLSTIVVQQGKVLARLDEAPKQLRQDLEHQRVRFAAERRHTKELEAQIDQVLEELDAKRAEAERLRTDRDLMFEKFRRVAEENDRLREALNADLVERNTVIEEVERLRKILDANGRDFQHERDKRRAVEAEVERLRCKRGGVHVCCSTRFEA